MSALHEEEQHPLHHQWPHLLQLEGASNYKDTEDTSIDAERGQLQRRGNEVGK